jgi:hypothetical protein
MVYPLETQVNLRKLLAKTALREIYSMNKESLDAEWKFCM